MNIICNNINDFCTMITTCTLNGINDVRVFISETSSIKNIKNFTYAFFSPLYTAIYTGNVETSAYNEIYKNLENCQEQCNHNFRIQIFDNLSFAPDKDILTVENEINVI